jgi:hypothetical protein
MIAVVIPYSEKLFARYNFFQTHTLNFRNSIVALSQFANKSYKSFFTIIYKRICL